MRGGDHSYVGVQLATWNVTEETPTLGTTVISFLLNYHIHCVEMPHQYKQ